jgi:hypothetical protein
MTVQRLQWFVYGRRDHRRAGLCAPLQGSITWAAARPPKLRPFFRRAPPISPSHRSPEISGDARRLDQNVLMLELARLHLGERPPGSGGIGRETRASIQRRVLIAGHAPAW